MKGFTLIEVAIVVAIIGIVGLIIFGGMNDVKEWNRFSARHNCKIVGKESASVGYATNGKGGVVLIPGKTGYLCDDGVTYWR